MKLALPVVSALVLLTGCAMFPRHRMPLAAPEHWEYSITNGTVAVGSWWTDLYSHVPVTIPGTIEGLPVTRIGDYAFENHFYPISVAIPASVTNIGRGAFVRCGNLAAITVDSNNSFYTSVDGVLFDKDKTTLIQCPGAKTGTYAIPGSVTRIGWAAFSECTNLTRVTLPDSITHIEWAAFCDCSHLTNIILPDSIVSIGRVAFAGCTSLTNITISAGLTNISSGAFYGCSRLRAITVDASNSVYTSADGVLFSKDGTSLILCPGGKTGSYTIPVSVTNIGAGAFAACDNLTNVNLSGSVRTIGNSAFATCGNLAGITIPSSITRIGAQAFLQCRNLASITIPDRVANIGQEMFMQCYGLTNVMMGSNVTNIGIRAFAHCRALTHIMIPDSVISIGDGAFAKCDNLANVTIPGKVTIIGSGAFSCARLSAITVDAGNAFFSSADGVLFNKDQETLIRCPVGKTGSYTIPDSVAHVGRNAFASCGSLTNVVMGSRVARIGDSAFSWCTGLTSMVIPDSVTDIGKDAFLLCNRLTRVTIGSSVTNIGHSAFTECTRLAGVYFQGNAPVLGSDVFERADKATLYYKPATKGWGETFGGRPAVLSR